MTVRGPLRVPLGGSAALTSDLVTVWDADTELSELVLTVEQRPTHGQLTQDDRVMADGAQFGVQQLRSHAIRSVAVRPSVCPVDRQQRRRPAGLLLRVGWHRSAKAS